MAVKFPKGLPKIMTRDEQCVACRKWVSPTDHQLSLEEKHVDFTYKCSCGDVIVFRYIDKHLQAYLDALTKPDIKPEA